MWQIAVGIFVMQARWRPDVVVWAAFSAGVFIIFWDGAMKKLSEKGGIALLINAAILVTLLALG